MAKAWVLKNRRGGLIVRARGVVNGRQLSRDKTIPNADEALANETARELNRRFMLGELDWLTASDARSSSRRRAGAPEFRAFSDRWLDDLEGQVEESTRMNYRSGIRAWQAELGTRRMNKVRTADLIEARKAWVAQGRSDRTIGDRMMLLKLMYRDALAAGVVEKTPFDTPLPRRNTKRARRDRSTRQVTFQPFSAAELERILEVVRNPKSESERRTFPLVEYLLLTGQRFGEGAALRFDDISRSRRSITIQRARAPRGETRIDTPTKTGAEWTIRMGPSLTALLARQREQHFLAGHGWVFPTEVGTPQLCSNWRRRGWDEVLKRARVEPRERDAQKALRRSYITSALVCGRNPKLIAAELGHATARMVVSQYDTFLDPAHWPDDRERAALVTIFEWSDVAIPLPESKEATG